MRTREDGFWLVNLDGRLLDVCVIAAHARYIRSHDGYPVGAGDFDRLGAGEGKWSEAAPFSPEVYSPKWSNSRMAVELVKELSGEPMPNSTYDAWIKLAYNLKFSGAKIEFDDASDQQAFDAAIERRKAEVAAISAPPAARP